MCVRGKTPWGPQSLLSDPRERWFPFFLSSCFPFLFCLPHFVSVILVHYLCLTANLWVLSGITLMEDGGSYFMPKLDEPQEYVMEKQLHLLAKRGAFWHSICRFLPCGEIMPPSIPTLGMGWVTAGTAGWRHGLKAGVQTEQIKIQDAPSVSRDILRCKKKKKKGGLSEIHMYLGVLNFIWQTLAETVAESLERKEIEKWKRPGKEDLDSVDSREPCLFPALDTSNPKT